MGRRVNYEFYAGEDRLGIVLYSNSSHPDVDPEAIFRELTQDCPDEPTRLIRSLLNVKYGSAYSRHSADDHIFFVDLEPGDRDVVLAANIAYGTVIQIEG